MTQVKDWTERLTERERDSFWLAHRQHLRVEKYAGCSRPITELNHQFANAFRTIATLRALVEELQRTIRERQLHIPTEGDIAAEQLDEFGRSCDCPYCVVLTLTEADMRERL